ncbi:Peroxiredoxin family protein [hydrothermal vent metagenome]|uniref:Peroxiredoxin family protein n=1 Tax=hydrothermal vent metagenome TaxID=652676 RepID=A0A3B1BXS8_9ZZZZ
MAIAKHEIEQQLRSNLNGLELADLNNWFDSRFDEKMQEIEENHVPSLSIVVTKGTLDMAYPPFILASTAAALGWKVDLFFTFYGLELLKKNLDGLMVSPLGNPAMPMKMPFGPEWFKSINWNVPNAVMGNVPGFENIATGLMKKTVKNKGVASVQELREACIESEVNLVACQMTVDLFGFETSDFIPEVADWIGAASFLPIAQKSDVGLFI